MNDCMTARGMMTNTVMYMSDVLHCQLKPQGVDPIFCPEA